jgi:hypothetical protein
MYVSLWFAVNIDASIPQIEVDVLQEFLRLSDSISSDLSQPSRERSNDHCAAASSGDHGCYNFKRGHNYLFPCITAT